MNGQYYANLLAQAREAVVQKRRGKLSRAVLFLQDNASVHTARVSRQALKNTGFSEIDHPPYSPDLAPSDYFLFPNLKKELRGRRFVDDNQMKMVVRNAQNYAAVQLVTKASQWRKIGTRGKRRKIRRVLNLRITSFAANSERQSVVRCTLLLRSNSHVYTTRTSLTAFTIALKIFIAIKVFDVCQSSRMNIQYWIGIRSRRRDSRVSVFTSIVEARPTAVSSSQVEELEPYVFVLNDFTATDKRDTDATTTSVTVIG
ncbi:Histone-lysine N-methyltransferase SETMAR [Eumeta japonica]|uniref:Histone-lysine N-methyltransferase SETMAR n=1 Tax=Eumeta variegata TaxID=151549 RepID=A0A4C1YVJ9_EUMVA|nr:Histone-lysine N-methyltransferase SETMAR [Eumeta japonica]